MPYRTPLEVGHRAAIGGMWDEVGTMQLEFLVDRGLRPHHRFLDVGCGSLRAGVKLIPYLEPGNYSGIDQEQSLLDAGRDVELGRDAYDRLRPQLVQMADFDLTRLGRGFDFGIAQSVFSHLEFNLIARCLSQVARVLEPGGTFFATYFRNPDGVGRVAPIPRAGGTFESYCDRDPFHYDVDQMRWLAERLGLEFEDIGDWNHPRGQEMLAFRKPADAPAPSFGTRADGADAAIVPALPNATPATASAPLDDAADLAAASTFQAALEVGVRAASPVLELGCGDLRSGRLLMAWLDPGCYAGLEADGAVLDAAIDEAVGREFVERRDPLLVASSLLAPTVLDREFSLVVCDPSLLDGEDALRRCLAGALQVLAPGGLVLGALDLPSGRLDAITSLAGQLGLVCERLATPHPTRTWVGFQRADEVAGD